MFKIRRFFLVLAIVTQLPMVASYLYEDPRGILSVNINLIDAVRLHSMCLLSFVFAYLVTDYGKVVLPSQERYKFQNPYLGYIFSICGVVVVLLQVSQSSSLADHFVSLFYGNSVNSREAYLLESEKGGLPGYIKIFANAPLAVYLFAFASFFCISLDETSARELRKVLVFSLVCVIIKTFFSLDRLSLLALLLTFSYYTASKHIKLSSYLILVTLLFLANFLSGARLEGYTIFDFVLLYMKLGLINLQMVMDGGHELTFGFQTFFHFTTYFDRTLFEIFDLEFQEYAYYWNPALYFVSYGFLDFSYGIVLVHMILGIFASYLDRAIARRRVTFFQINYFVFLYGFASFFTVPAIRGVEFILAILICAMLAKTTLKTRV